MAALDDGSDAALEGWVPSLDHATFADWDRVYEPSEDTFLLLDALFAERASLRALAPRSVVEIGPGSGAVSAYVARLLAPALRVARPSPSRAGRSFLRPAPFLIQQFTASWPAVHSSPDFGHCLAK